MNTKKLFAILVFLAVFAFAFTTIIDPDFGWHLKTGEYIVTQLKIPQRDIFSFTAQGQPWITEEWLTEVVIYLLFQAGGYLPVMIFFALVPAIALTIIYWHMESHPSIAAISALAASWVVSAYWGVRPQMMTFLFAGIFLFILERYRREGAGRFLWALVPVMILWPNAHGGFLIGPVLIGVYLVADTAQLLWQRDKDSARWRNLGDLGTVLFACVFVIAFNPNGLALYAYPIQTLLSPVIQSVIVEWQPPDLGMPATFPFVLFLTALLTALVFSRRRFALTDAILILGLTFASLRQTRQIALWALVAAPVLAASLNDILGSDLLTRFERVRSGLAQYAKFAVGAAVIALVALVVFRANSALANQANAEQRYFPVRAVQFIQDKQLSGPLFNSYQWGGYLIWKLYPQQKVFIDGRSDVYGLHDPFFYNLYASAYNAGPTWRETLSQFNVRLVLVEAESALAQTLAKDSRWSQVYSDDQAAVFTRK